MNVQKDERVPTVLRRARRFTGSVRRGSRTRTLRLLSGKRKYIVPLLPVEFSVLHGVVMNLLRVEAPLGYYNRFLLFLSQGLRPRRDRNAVQAFPKSESAALDDVGFQENGT